ncbi:diguanylate cyclase (GGDEF) domain-containing protein [Paenibacillus sp. UNCCL117]|uniref:GGDEF domain-containing protein n=1 Tax=unclassified Paenibacillus TaxID=185978 RepID=UPI000889A411|nr:MULTISPECIES: GGDEF domain-containing protein [unclassified Paenibacillus]SDC01653.1 diguanylate cyclase (GGDEF) domain-containing protein [Paenibacillus sp. cl123]SFW36677.1 diguanylate cyclase (GGDEF) domain-containing protein [Paenibacillus sp. UNCCL117]
MVFDVVNHAKMPRWNRRFLNGYWIIAVICIAASAALAGVYSYTRSQDYPIALVGQFACWTCIGLLVVEAVLKLLKSWNDYIVITGGLILSLNLIISFPMIGPLITTLFLPILTSIFYFQGRKIVFAFFITLAALWTLYGLQLKHMSAYTDIDLFVMTIVLLIGTFLGLEVMKRGSDLMKDLRSTIASEQDLLVKNILMDKLAKTDALTGLYNHMSFHEYLEELIRQGEQNDLSFQLALLDIDHFKKVNDTYGHRAGDAVLKKVACILQEMVSPNDFPARYGGEEFAILFTETDARDALLQLERIRHHISAVRHEELNGNQVTISIGLHAFYKGCAKEDLFGGADTALYRAKHKGRNRIELYQEERVTLTS